MWKKASCHAVAYVIFIQNLYTLIHFTSLRNNTYYIFAVYEFKINAVSLSSEMSILKSTINSSSHYNHLFKMLPTVY